MRHVRRRFRNCAIKRCTCRADRPCAGCGNRIGAGSRSGLLHRRNDPKIEAGNAKLRRDKYGITSERRTRLIDQLELQLEELEVAATEDALAAEQAADKASTVRAFTRRKPVRKPFPPHLPRERVVVEAPTSCTCCGSDRIVKMGEDITETLEGIPRQWKVIQTVREKFSKHPA